MSGVSASADPCQQENVSESAKNDVSGVVTVSGTAGWPVGERVW